jgi:hypothetical protein
MDSAVQSVKGRNSKTGIQKENKKVKSENVKHVKTGNAITK